VTSKFKIKDLDILYTPDLDGGGTSIGQDFVNVLRYKYPYRKFDHCLDWCAGPGFIGLSLLINNFCSNLCLVDSNQVALEYARESLINTHYEKLVTTYNISSIKNLPNEEKFDLIVSNPPHFSSEVYWQEHIHHNLKQIYLDPNWSIHADFFQHIKSHLSNDGVIILQESVWGCNVNTFDTVLNESGLTVKDHYSEFTKHPYPIFYLEIGHK